MSIHDRAEALEAVVTRIWAEELGVEEISPADDFFDLGGDSLQVITVVRRTRAELDVKVPARTLFDAPRFGDFVERVRDAAVAGG